MVEKLRCSKCGVEARCSCGAPYVSKLEYAKAHMKADKPDRENGKELGVSTETIRKARKQFPTKLETETKRKGKDGKMYPAEKKNGHLPRGRPLEHSRPAWVAPAPRRRRGETKTEYADRWSKLTREKRIEANPSLRWEDRFKEILSPIITLEQDWKAEHGDSWRQFVVEPCTLNLLKQAAEVLNKLLSASKFNKQDNKEHDNVVHH